MSTIRYQKRYNKWYVYKITQYWDKELKKPRQKTQYLGVADKKDGDYSKPGKKVVTVKSEKSILDYGDSYAINEVSKNIGLNDIIENCFGDLDSIMALLCYQIITGSALYNCESWFEGNIAKELFPQAKVSSQNISRLIHMLGKQDLQITFFKSYIDKFFGSNKNVLIDSTALPSSINSSINACGYAGNTIAENVTCLMLVDKKTKLPIYFRAIGGDIADISSLKTTVAEIKKLGLKPNSAILDAGFCSKDNLQFMCQEEISFITRLPKSHKVFHELVKETGFIEDLTNAIKYGERFVFIKSRKIQLYGNEVYAHVIFDPHKKSQDTQFILKNSLDSKVTKKEKEEFAFKMQSAGFLILLSRENIAASEILPSYYERQAIEQVFGFAKHNNNILLLKVHSEQSIKGYLMLVFLAFIVFIAMKQKLKMPMDKALFILHNLKAKVFENEIVVQELNKKTKQIMSALDIIIPKHPGI